jgi:hypothetical protein
MGVFERRLRSVGVVLLIPQWSENIVRIEGFCVRGEIS